ALISEAEWCRRLNVARCIEPLVQSCLRGSRNHGKAAWNDVRPDSAKSKTRAEVIGLGAQCERKTALKGGDAAQSPPGDQAVANRTSSGQPMPSFAERQGQG